MFYKKSPKTAGRKKQLVLHTDRQDWTLDSKNLYLYNKRWPHGHGELPVFRFVETVSLQELTDIKLVGDPSRLNFRHVSYFIINGIQLHGVYTQKWDPPVIDDADWKAASFEDMEAVKPDSLLDWRFLWNEDRMWDPDCMALFHAAFGRDILRTDPEDDDQATIFAEEIFLFQHNLVYPVEKGYWMLTFAPYDPTDQLDFRWIYGHTPASHIQALLPMLREMALRNEYFGGRIDRFFDIAPEGGLPMTVQEMHPRKIRLPWVNGPVLAV